MTTAPIDDLSAPPPQSSHAGRWALILDRVMGGLSQGSMQRETLQGREAIRLRGAVSLENNGGFVQIALDLDPQGRPIDAGAWRGVEIDVLGNGATYNLHLRSADTLRPWQSYRQSFPTSPKWQTHRLAFADFHPHRIDTALDLRRLRRIGLVAIGREFEADLALGGLRFFV